MGPFKAEETPEQAIRKIEFSLLELRALLKRQADDGALWFGTDVNYVRGQLRELTRLLEGD